VRRVSSIVAGAFRYVVFGNLFLAASAAAWAYSTYSVLGLPRGAADYDLLGLVFAGVVVVYALDRLYAFDRSPEQALGGRLRWVDEHRRFLLTALVVACAGVAVLLFFVNAQVLVVLGVLGAVSFAYSLPILRHFTVGLKDAGLSKVFLIALVWTCVTVVLPPLEAGASVLTRDVALLFAERFVFVFAISLPFDIRDRERDASRGIRTIPVAIGVARSKQLVGIALVAHLWLKVIHYYPAHPAMLVPAAIAVAYSCLLLAGLSASRGDVYYSLLWDGAILVQAVLAVGFAPR
jgi:4-hydroxybenzoate polyprenyltransferase